ncbi:MAG: arginine--tRNA ligase [Patescibacteria group bacterium]|nr:arginine--tRNA ligase [Patescibacteria group bacterium]
MNIEKNLRTALVAALATFGIEGLVPMLEHPADASNGDYSTNVALAAAKKANATPREFAEKIIQTLPVIDGVSRTEIAGPGFINFYLARSFFSESMREIAENEEWGKGDSLSGKRIMYEYTDPNPFKVFHIGHLMSNAIGESLARLAEHQGAKVVRANYQGDIGLHVAKCIWGLQKVNLDPSRVQDLGSAYVIGASAYEENEEAKKEIDALNKRLYANDPELQPLYDAGRKTSLEHFEELYKVLGTRFDYYFFETEVWPKGVAMVRDAESKGIFEESDGAVIYKGEKKGLHTRVFITRAGTPTYEAKDLGLNAEKFEKEPLDQSIIVTANEQSGYFAVVLAALADILPDVARKTTHVSHGFMQLSKGKMSSRKGNVVSGESLITEMRAKALAKMEGRDLGEEKQAVADSIAVAAIKYSILRQATGKDILFDPEQSLSFEGDSGPYLQYAHVRAGAVLRKAAEAKIQKDPAQTPDNAILLERFLYRFPAVAARAQKENEPHYLVTFLTDIAGMFNSWYAQEKIVDADDSTSSYKVLLVNAFANVMKNGLWLLGIEAPRKM